MLLNFGGRKRSGAFDTVWPSARFYEKHVNLQIALRAACFCAVTHSCLHCASLPLFFLVFFCCPGFVFSCFACTLLIITLMPSFCCLFCWMMLGAPRLLCTCWVLSPLKIQPASPRERSRIVCPLSLRGDRFACCLYAVFLWCLIWAISKNRDRCSETHHKTKRAILAPIQIEGFRSWLLL